MHFTHRFRSIQVHMFTTEEEPLLKFGWHSLGRKRGRREWEGIKRSDAVSVISRRENRTGSCRSSGNGKNEKGTRNSCLMSPNVASRDVMGKSGYKTLSNASLLLLSIRLVHHLKGTFHPLLILDVGIAKFECND